MSHDQVCEVLLRGCSHNMCGHKTEIRLRDLSPVSLFLVYNDVLFFLVFNYVFFFLHSILCRCRVLSWVSLFLVYNDVLFFPAFNYISFFLFSCSDHCRRWKCVMRELLAVTSQ